MNENNEIWKDVSGYEGLYKVSNFGRVKSLWFGNEKILKPSNNGYRYLFVNLYKNGKMKYYKVHRLVTQTFIPNPNKLPYVNHKDENPSNNRVENLEWCDQKYNLNYGTRNQRISEKMTNGKLSKPVLQYEKSGEFVREWKSTRDVQRNLGFNIASISLCCNGKSKSAYGFVWKYKK